MKAHVLGFEFKPEGGVSLLDLMNHLKANRGQAIMRKPYNRMLFIDETDEAWFGLVLSVKDQRRFAELEQQDGKFVLSVREVEEGKSAVDFNFFALVKATGKGAYLHYHQSFSMQQFYLLCEAEYRSLRDAAKKAALEALPTNATNRQKKAARDPYKNTLGFDAMVRPESVPELLENMKRVSSVQFETATLTVRQNAFTAVNNLARKKILRYGFSHKQPMAEVFDAVKTAVREGHIRKGKISGRDLSDAPWSFNLSDNLSSFADYEYDDIAGEIAFDIEDGKLLESPVAEKLKQIITTNNTFFNGN